jgi:hypothetical protein
MAYCVFYQGLEQHPAHTGINYFWINNKIEFESVEEMNIGDSNKVIYHFNRTLLYGQRSQKQGGYYQIHSGRGRRN